MTPSLLLSWGAPNYHRMHSSLGTATPEGLWLSVPAEWRLSAFPTEASEDETVEVPWTSQIHLLASCKCHMEEKGPTKPASILTL